MQPLEARKLAIVLALGSLGGTACRDSLASGPLLDEARYEFSLTIEGAEDEAMPDAPLALGVLWVDPAQRGKANDVAGLELVPSAIRGDGDYRVRLVLPPDDGVIARLKSRTGAHEVAFAWGEIVLFEDRDHDGTFRVGSVGDGSPMLSGDVYRGTPASNVLVYVEKPLAPHDSAILGLTAALERPGYFLAKVSCGGVTPATEGDARLELAPPSTTYAGARTCMRSHP